MDALDLLLNSVPTTENVCRKNPMFVKKAAVFLVDTSQLGSPDDLKKLTTLELGIIKGNLCENTRLSVRSQAQCMGLTKHRSQGVMYTNSQGCTTTIRILLNSDILSSMHMVRAYTCVVTLLACHVQVTFLSCTGMVKGCY